MHNIYIWGVGLAKEHSLLSKVIHVRGFHGRWFVDVITLDVLPAQIINDDQENVRLGWSRLLLRVRFVCYEQAQ